MARGTGVPNYQSHRLVVVPVGRIAWKRVPGPKPRPGDDGGQRVDVRGAVDQTKKKET